LRHFLFHRLDSFPASHYGLPPPLSRTFSREDKPVPPMRGLIRGSQKYLYPSRMSLLVHLLRHGYLFFSFVPGNFPRCAPFTPYLPFSFLLFPPLEGRPFFFPAPPRRQIFFSPFFAPYFFPQWPTHETPLRILVKAGAKFFFPFPYNRCSAFSHFPLFFFLGRGKAAFSFFSTTLLSELDLTFSSSPLNDALSLSSHEVLPPSR